MIRAITDPLDAIACTVVKLRWFPLRLQSRSSGVECAACELGRLNSDKMNTCKISYDGRVTFWNARIKTMERFEPTRKSLSAEGRLFFSLCPDAKRRFLLSGMGLSHVTNLDAQVAHSSKERRGVKGISTYGRSLVRMGCQALEDRHGVKCLSFLTLTLPDTLLAVCTPGTWAQVLNRFLKSLTRRLLRAKLSPLQVGCVEIQEKRAIHSESKPPLHLHLVFQGREIGKSWAIRPDEFQALWAQACRSVWGGSHQFLASVRVESLRVSAVSYLGKYMSKGGSALVGVDSTLLPSSWYTITRSLKDFVKRAEFKLSGDTASDLFHWFKDHEFLIWTREVWSQQCADGSYFLMAWIGAIRGRSKYWEIVDAMRHFVARRSSQHPVRFSSLFATV